MLKSFFQYMKPGRGYYAKSVGPAIFAEGDTIDELKTNIKGGVDC